MFQASTTPVRPINLFLIAVGLLLFLAACGSAEPETAIGLPEKEYTRLNADTFPDVISEEQQRLMAQTPYENEIVAIVSRLNALGLAPQFQLATEGELADLAAVGIPETVLEFYKVANPAEDQLLGGVNLIPASALVDFNQNTILGEVARLNEFVIIADTDEGDAFIMPRDGSGEQQSVYILNLDVQEGAVGEVFAAAHAFVAPSFNDFLSMYASGRLPFAYYQVEQGLEITGFGDAFQRYDDDSGRFGIEYPNNWIVMADPQQPNQINFVNPSFTDSPRRAIISVLVQPSGQNLERTIDASNAFMQEQEAVTDFTINQEQTVSVNGLLGLEQLVSYQVGETEIVQRMVYLQDAQRVYVIGMASQPEEQKRLNDAFEYVLRSFES
ncbi:MAG: hypothetical protein QNJ45_14545 [Ardenticatenaceae bacterium]|nr:hypothetical protein [Ardenticatenaceae bacterium]